MSNFPNQVSSHWNNDATVTLVQVKSLPAQITFLSLCNLSSFECYVWIYDAQAANVTVNTTPPFAVLPVASLSYDNINFSTPVETTTALTYQVSTSPTTVTAPSGSSSIQLQMFYR